MATGSTADVLIAAAMCYYVRAISLSPVLYLTDIMPQVAKTVSGDRFPKDSGFGIKSDPVNCRNGNIDRQRFRIFIPKKAHQSLTASISLITLILFYLTPQFFVTPLAMLAKTYSTTMMAVLNSRIKLGIISESSTWLENELHIPLSHIRPTEGIMFDIRSSTVGFAPNAGAVHTQTTSDLAILKKQEVTIINSEPQVRSSLILISGILS